MIGDCELMRFVEKRKSELLFLAGEDNRTALLVVP